MKGPYERLKYDLQRVWECPKCRQRQQTDGTTTGRYCQCQGGLPEEERRSMTLVHDGIRLHEAKQSTAETPKAAGKTEPAVEPSEPTPES